MLVSVAAAEILPSQDFLKEKTIAFIFSCVLGGNTEDLPPTPLVRRRADGRLVAIDGHNLIALRYFLKQHVEVEVASNAHDGLPPTSPANIERNKDLAEKFDSVLAHNGVLRTKMPTSKALATSSPNIRNSSPKTWQRSWQRRNLW